MKFIPWEYQDLIINHIKKHERNAIFADMGMGKTSSTLTALADLQMIHGDVYPILVVAPLRVAKTTWPDEIEKWDHLKDLRVSKIIGKEDRRVKAIKRRADIYTTNFAQLQWLVDFFGKKWPFKTIVVDESTRLKGFRLRQGSKRARALSKVAHKFSNRFIELTGTPAPNGLIDLWGQIWFLDKGKRLGRTFGAFKDRWFFPDWSGYGVIAHDFANDQIQKEISDICLSVKADDYFDLDKPNKIEVEVELPPKARKIYTEMEREMYIELENEPIEAVNAAVKTGKCLQIANGAAYFEDDKGEKGWKKIHNEKIEALRSIIEENNGAPILVAYNFKSDLERLQKAFPQGVVLDKESETQYKWRKGEIPLLFAHPASAGHGLNLAEGGHHLVFFSLSWNLENHLQIIERIGPVRQKQAGLDRLVHIYYLMAKDTIDEIVLERLNSKRSVQDILTEAMKKRGIEV